MLQQQQQAWQQQWKSLTLEQKLAIGANIALYPAMTVMIFIRRRLGYRFISLPKLVVMSVFLLILGALAGALGSLGRNSWLVVVFSLAVFVVGVVERRFRWREIKAGVSWHSYSRGISWLNNFLPYSDSTIKRFFDPAAVLVVGVIFVVLIQPILGYYFIFSALCLFSFEAYDFERSINMMLDQLDAMIDSEVISSNVEYYSQPGEVKQRPLEQTAGIPTGVAPDLQAAIERRRSRSIPPANGAMPGTQYHPSRQTAPTSTAPTAIAAAVPAGQNGQGDIDDLALVPANQNNPTPPAANQNQPLDNLVLPDEADGTA